VFGSVARSAAGPGSDIDILVEFAPGQPRDIYAYVGIQRRVAGLFPGRVDMVDRGALRHQLHDAVTRDLLDAF
jgi:predicted nucleotidyltransferase